MDSSAGLTLSGGRAWQSHGGKTTKHPWRAFPKELEVQFDEGLSATSVTLVGVFALASGPVPKSGIAASVSVQGKSGKEREAIDLAYGTAIVDSATPGPHCVILDHGGLRRCVGETVIDGQTHRVDALSLPLSESVDIESLRLSHHGGAESILVFDVLVESVAGLCPFRGAGTDIGLGDIAGILRMRDTSRFHSAVDQLRSGLLACGKDVDEARGVALTFMAVTSAALLELGTKMRLHRLQLDLARKLEKANSCAEVADTVCITAVDVVREALPEDSKPTDVLIDRALVLMRQKAGEDVDGDTLAREIGLSTSHFRHLFRERTGTSFQKYLTSLRLELAREKLVSTQVPIGEIAEELGFVSAAHFSRVFSARFGASPSSMRKSHTVSSNSARFSL